jgi:hypothetical protein
VTRRLASLLACGVALVLPARSDAAYIAPGANIVSASPVLREEGDDSSSQGDVSADGRFVVFRTTARNLFPDDVVDPPGEYYAGGIYERDLSTGALSLVALGDLRKATDDSALVSGATAPSVSGDGRYVAFTTAQALVPADTNGATDVYVRDMSVPRTDPHAYDLVSALDGGDVPASYAPPTPDTPGADPGADSSPGTAISDDGRMVAFSVREQPTNLPDHAAVDVPAGQIFVRDRTTRHTTLVTRIMATGQPVQSPASFPSAMGAVEISGDGTTVLWAGQFAADQTRFLNGEASDPRTYYYLWRRIADGPSAPTRRITGASDPDDPACNGTYTPNPTATGPCYGPLAENEQGFGTISATAPAMSYDGRTVAFTVAGAPRPLDLGVVPDLYVTSMADGVSRKAGTTELTREGTGRDGTDSAPITGLAMSEDARWIVVITQRVRFLLPALSLLGDVRATPQTSDAYLVDMGQRTIQRAVHAYTGGDPDGGIGNQPSISADGRRIVFDSSADNLFFGDANQRADVFSVDRQDAAPPSPDDTEVPDPPAPLLPPPAAAAAAKKLSVSVGRAKAGRIRVKVKAPAKGTIDVAVRGKAPDKDGVQRGSAKLLASAKVKVTKKRDVTVDVTLAKKYRSGLRKAGSLDASAAVRFKPAKGDALERTVNVRFKSR